MAEKSEKKEEKTVEKTTVVVKEQAKKFAGAMIREYVQDFLILLLIALGLRKPLEKGEKLPSGKEVPGWFLSWFPSWTDEDEIEYNLCLDSHPNLEARIATEEFVDRLEKDKRFDEIRFRVRLIKLRREFMERLRHPMPKDESGGRLICSPLTLNDSVISFMDRMLEEKNLGGRPKEIYERQLKIADSRRLLKRISWMRRHKIITFCIAVFVTVVVFSEIIEWLISLFE